MNQRDNDAFRAQCGAEPTGDFTVEDHGQEVLVFGKLPGFEANELVLEVRHGALEVNATSANNERRYSKALPLPPGIPPGPVAYATFINGVLEVRLPKRKPATGT